MLLVQALADLYVQCRVSLLYLSCLLGEYINCLLLVLNVAELSQALADLYAGWPYSIWTF